MSELKFLRTLISLNLASAMEYRLTFIIQVIGMIVNNVIYFLFWFIFFDQFGDVRGYGFRDVYLLFAIVTFAFSLAFVFAGNTGTFLAEIIASGKLDYYLVFPRNLLTHVICSRMGVYAIGDLFFGLVAFAFSGYATLTGTLLYLLVCLLSALIMVGFGIVVGSLAFFIGNAQHTSQQLNNALLTFSLYPHTLFTGASRFIMFTLIPAGFVGAIPVDIVKGNDVRLLPALLLAVAVIWALALAVFYAGLRRYESGSAINVHV